MSKPEIVVQAALTIGGPSVYHEIRGNVAFSPLQGSFVSPMRDALSACVSTHDQPILAMQIDALHEFATRPGWTVMDRHPQCRLCSKPFNNASSM